jgi:hypothetical protein
VRVWAAVTTLWTAATLLRMYHLWLPAWDWQAVAISPYTWLSLLLPAIFFGLVSVAVGIITRPRKRLHH